ncbi:uncharacterized protein EI90DRAFT_3079984 [Cantharellus anzutake]|uniref:uncharacterized protein n=1 Tax=Cantharellus anzutake TaxID=1750568 RepID=UPI001906C008|nr:uncharacterized protein EI90DRAFT_3079984 [Cantharellus anzutake]KAF8321000.1 hypothetical protein EI90DRAFT_3079984 [Cantharellus anzutake]
MLRFYSSINALGSSRSSVHVAANLIQRWVSTIEYDASGHNQVAQCWPTSGTGTTPPNGSRPRGMLAARRYSGAFQGAVQRPKGKYIGLNKSRSRLYDEGWDDHDETLGMPACAEIAWHSGAILVDYINVTIEYDAAQQVEQVLVPQAPRKQLHRQLEWVEATWDGRDTRTVGPWSFQGAV